MMLVFSWEYMTCIWQFFFSIQKLYKHTALRSDSYGFYVAVMFFCISHLYFSSLYYYYLFSILSYQILAKGINTSFTKWIFLFQSYFILYLLNIVSFIDVVISDDAAALLDKDQEECERENIFRQVSFWFTCCL